jgi:hypothetical protein
MYKKGIARQVSKMHLQIGKRSNQICLKCGYKSKSLLRILYLNLIMAFWQNHKYRYLDNKAKRRF